SMTDDNAEDETMISRRWLIRILVGLGLGIPILVEGVTFFGLVSETFLGGDDGTTTTSTTTRQPTVGVGDELLPSTTPQETVREAYINIREAGWEFLLLVEVANTTEHPYEVDLGPVITDGGTTVEGSATTGRLSPGASETVTATWLLPSGATPDVLSVTGTAYVDGETRTTSRSVNLGSIAVRN
ncbi:MAG: hypothetical protein ABEI52_01300, partial [Halobacteriaceae archaeon]